MRGRLVVLLLTALLGAGCALLRRGRQRRAPVAWPTLAAAPTAAPSARRTAPPTAAPPQATPTAAPMPAAPSPTFNATDLSAVTAAASRISQLLQTTDAGPAEPAPEGVDGWAAKVPWATPSESQRLQVTSLPLQPAPERTVVQEQHTNVKVNMRTFNASPMCFEQGVGWVRIDAAGVPTTGGSLFTVMAERRRELRAVERKSHAGEHVHWSDRPAFLALAAMPGPPFHSVWPFMSFAMAIDQVDPHPEVVYVQTEGLATCRHTWGGGCCSLLNDECYPDFIWSLYKTLGDEVLPAHDFGASGTRRGTRVCHRWGIIAASDMQQESRGASLTARKTNKCRVSRKGKRKCRPNVRQMMAWPVLQDYRKMHMAGRYGLAIARPSPPRAHPRLLMVSRTQTRTFANQPALHFGAKQLGFDSVVAALEKLPVARQLAVISETDVIAAVHGSAHIWALFSVPGQVWIEVVNAAPHAPHLSFPYEVGINQYTRGQYCAYATIAGAHHLGWITEKPLTGVAADRWKTYNVTVPVPVWVHMLMLAGKLVRNENPCAARDRRDCFVKTVNTVKTATA
eukprot:TRINITY_DN30955_c0_g1_i1.p1 TRINITY_DN30955_c0_g1~~TRINITY_DN30955_c0_g1_i1.p1  ORF type:complete len:568 (+),score=159.56 TRINITY_DN30955_c0_g1_i1:56-1759(+)